MAILLTEYPISSMLKAADTSLVGSAAGLEDRKLEKEICMEESGMLCWLASSKKEANSSFI